MGTTQSSPTPGTPGTPNTKRKFASKAQKRKSLFGFTRKLSTDDFFNVGVQQQSTSNTADKDGKH